MLAKTNKTMWHILWFGTLFCFIGLLFAMPCLAQRAPKGKAVIVHAEPVVMTGGDCHTAQGLGSLNVAPLIHEGLVRKDPDGRMIPALAKSWEFGKDGLSIKFTLNERAKFHNGEPVTAKDVKFSIERAMRPELKYRGAGGLIRSIDRIEVMDDHHLTVYFKLPLPAFLEWGTQHLGIVPKAYVEKVGDAEFAKHPIGAGPFRWIDYQQDVFINVEAVEDHYRKVPQVKTLHSRCVTEEATIMAMFKSGEADIVQLSSATYPEVKNDPKLKVVWSKFVCGPSVLFFDLAFPNEPSPFHDVRVRRAVSYAINRKVICEKLLHGAAEPWGDLLAPYQPGCDPNLKPHPYDPEKAKALLKEAGYPNGFDTTMPCGLFLGDKMEAQAIAADLARVGIRANIAEMETGTYVRALREKKLRGVGPYHNPWWGGQSHPGVALESAVSSQSFWTYVVTPEAEAAWKKLYGLTDEKEIGAQARELSRIWRESEIRYMLWAHHEPVGLSARVKSYKPIPGWKAIGGLEFLELND
jgi:peptide/nickel transport system substrate-binding protein